MRFSAEIHVLPLMKFNEFGDPPTFSQSHSQVQIQICTILWFMTKYQLLNDGILINLSLTLSNAN